MCNELGNQRRPVFLNEALAHQGNAFEEKSCELVIRTSHKQAHEMLLKNGFTIFCYPVSRVTWIIDKAFLTLLLSSLLHNLIVS